MNIDPIQSGDGSQAVSGSLRGVAPGGFGPERMFTGTTNVVAPTNVHAGPSGAALLAGQLQQSLQTMHWPMMEAERSAGILKGRQSFAAGTAAAEAGNIDPKLAQADANYNAGAVKVIAQKHAIQASAAWAQYAADPQNGVDKLNPQQLTATLDGFLRQRLGGLENDPDAAVAMEPIVSHLYSETLGHAVQNLTAQRFQDALTNATVLAATQAEHGGKNVGITGGSVFDYQQQLGILTSQAGGNRVYAKQHLDNGIVQMAISRSNPAILDEIQAAPGQPALGPRTAELVTQAKLRIAAQNRYQNAIADRQAQTSAYMAILHGSTAQNAVQTYVGTSPAADPSMIPRLLSFSKFLNDSSASQAATGPDAADLNAKIVQGDITTPAQVQDYITAKGYQGKAAVSLMREGLGMVSSVSRENLDNPYYSSTVHALALRYRPKTPLPGMGIDQSQASQYAGVMQDFSGEYTKAVQAGKSPAQAAFEAQQSITKKYGDPLSALDGKQTTRVPETDAEQVHMLTTDPKAAKAAGIGAADLQRLYLLGMLSDSQVQAIGRIYLTK